MTDPEPAPAPPAEPIAQPVSEPAVEPMPTIMFEPDWLTHSAKPDPNEIIR